MHAYAFLTALIPHWLSLTSGQKTRQGEHGRQTVTWFIPCSANMRTRPIRRWDCLCPRVREPMSDEISTRNREDSVTALTHRHQHNAFLVEQSQQGEACQDRVVPRSSFAVELRDKQTHEFSLEGKQSSTASTTLFLTWASADYRSGRLWAMRHNS